MVLVSAESAPVFTVLLTCTGNICRSALAENLSRAYLAREHPAVADRFRFASAGTGAVVDSAMHPDSARVLQDLGGVSEGFRARQLTERIVGEADLVLTMTREHRRLVLERAPRMLSRTFTLREAAALAGLIDRDAARSEDAVERAREIVRALADARSRRRGSVDDDVRDPIGQPFAVHDEVGRAIADALLPLLDRLAGSGESARGTTASPVT